MRGAGRGIEGRGERGERGEGRGERGEGRGEEGRGGGEGEILDTFLYIRDSTDLGKVGLHVFVVLGNVVSK